VNVANANFRLRPNSPCINTGDHGLDFAYGGSGLGSRDLDGRPRFVESPDLGAYEFQPGASGEFIGWLHQYGIATDGSADYADSDGDSMSNWQEWLAGTSPTNSSSVLKMFSPTNGLSGIGLRWQSIENRTYFLERSTNLAPGSFSTVASNLAGQAGTTSFIDTNAAGAGPLFFRVGVQP